MSSQTRSGQGDLVCDGSTLTVHSWIPCKMGIHINSALLDPVHARERAQQCTAGSRAQWESTSIVHSWIRCTVGRELNRVQLDPVEGGVRAQRSQLDPVQVREE